MKYLGDPDATLTTMWVIARYIAARGPMSQDQLLADLRPTAWTSGPGTALINSISVGTDLGLFEESETAKATLDLAQELSAREPWFDEFDGFASVARRLIVQQSTQPPSDRSDVATGVAWLLSSDWRLPQDPLKGDRPPSGVIVNSTQSTAFTRWARDLGVGNGFNRSGLMPDPTAAIRRDVRSLRGQRLAARDFVRHLAITLPVGPSHPLSARSNGSEDSPADLEVFSSVGFALRRLEAEGLVVLSVADDAPERILFRFPGPKDQFIPVTHLEVAND